MSVNALRHHVFEAAHVLLEQARIAHRLQDLQALLVHRQRDIIARIRLLQPPFGQQPAWRVANQQHAVGHRQRLVDIVRDQDGGGLVTRHQFAQQHLHLTTRNFIQRAERLVQHQHFGLARKGTGQRHALRHAAGQLRRVLRGRMQQIDFSQRLAHTLALGLLADLRLVLEGQAKRHIVLHRQPGQQRGTLEHEGGTRVRCRQRLAKQRHLAFLRLLQPGQHAQQRGLAHAARTEQRNQLTRLHVNGKAFQHPLRTAVGACIAQRNIASLQQGCSRLGHRHHSGISKNLPCPGRNRGRPSHRELVERVPGSMPSGA